MLTFQARGQQNALFRMQIFKKIPGVIPRDPHCGRGRPPSCTLGRARGRFAPPAPPSRTKKLEPPPKFFLATPLRRRLAYLISASGFPPTPALSPDQWGRFGERLVPSTRKKECVPQKRQKEKAITFQSWQKIYLEIPRTGFRRRGHEAKCWKLDKSRSHSVETHQIASDSASRLTLCTLKDFIYFFYLFIHQESLTVGSWNMMTMYTVRNLAQWLMKCGKWTKVT